MGLVPFSHCKYGALHKPEITLYRSVTCSGHYKEHEVGQFWLKNKRLWLGTLPTTFNPSNTIAICSKKIKHWASPIYMFYLKWVLLYATIISAENRPILRNDEKEPLQLNISFSKLSWRGLVVINIF